MGPSLPSASPRLRLVITAGSWRGPNRVLPRRELCQPGEMQPDSDTRVALVAGATRGAGRAIAVELARAGFFVYATGRSSRVSGPSEIGRPETIEETGDLIRAAGEGRGRRLGPGGGPRGSGGGGRAGGGHRARARPARRAGQRHLRRRPVRPVGQAAVGARLAGRAADAPDGRAHPPHHVPGRHPADPAHDGRAREPGPGHRDDRRHLGGQRRTSGAASASTTTWSRPTSSGSSSGCTPSWPTIR